MKKYNKAGVEYIRNVEQRGNNVVILCRCPDCGNEFSMWRSHFYRGSNGCKCRVMHCHGTRLYEIWTNMKTRCYNPNTRSRKNYYDRGISICDEWIHSYASFRDWALSNGYDDSLTIDRIDNNKGYSPDNCRWATLVQQARNKRLSVMFSVEGLMIPAKECSERFGINYKALMSYYYSRGRGATEERLNNIAKELRNDHH